MPPLSVYEIPFLVTLLLLVDTIISPHLLHTACGLVRLYMYHIHARFKNDPSVCPCARCLSRARTPGRRPLPFADNFHRHRLQQKLSIIYYYLQNGTGITLVAWCCVERLPTSLKRLPNHLGRGHDFRP
jgi:hypothetical protein